MVENIFNLLQEAFLFYQEGPKYARQLSVSCCYVVHRKIRISQAPASVAKALEGSTERHNVSLQGGFAYL